MKEIRGDLWDYYEKIDHVICITTNGFLKKNGDAVMGRGCAYEATQYIPGITRILGRHIRANGNTAGILRVTADEWAIIAFPVKHVWWEPADPELIKVSVAWLVNEAEANPSITYVLPKPGCGNGRLTWITVKPLCMPLPDNVWVISK